MKDIVTVFNVELRKILITNSIRATIIFTLCVPILFFGIGFLGSLIALTYQRINSENSFPLVSRFWVTLFLFMIGVTVIAALIFNSDWKNRNIITNFLCIPNRKIFYIAKVLIVMLIALAFNIIAFIYTIIQGVVNQIFFRATMNLDYLFESFLGGFFILAYVAIFGAASSAAIMNTTLSILSIFLSTTVFTYIVIMFFFTATSFLSIAGNYDTLSYNIGISFMLSIIPQTPIIKIVLILTGEDSSYLFQNSSLTIESIISILIWVVLPFFIGYLRNERKEAR